MVRVTVKNDDLVIEAKKGAKKVKSSLAVRSAKTA
jgi:hypothetical protein